MLLYWTQTPKYPLTLYCCSALCSWVVSLSCSDVHGIGLPRRSVTFPPSLHSQHSTLLYCSVLYNALAHSTIPDLTLSWSTLSHSSILRTPSSPPSQRDTSWVTYEAACGGGSEEGYGCKAWNWEKQRKRAEPPWLAGGEGDEEENEGGKLGRKITNRIDCEIASLFISSWYVLDILLTWRRRYALI